MVKINSFIRDNPTFTDADSISRLCEPLSLLGIHYFSHVHINHANEMAAIVTCPEFARHYLAEGYQYFDIHQLKIKQQKQRVIWDLIERKGQSKKMHDDFRAIFGFGHTCTIIQEDEQGRNYFNFATHYGQEGINQVYMQNMDVLERFVSYFQDRIFKDKSLNKAYQNRLSLDPNIGAYQTASYALEKSVEDFYQQTNTTRIFIDSQTYLTPAEYHCLYWLSLGKTLEETAMILSLSTRTIKAHVQSAKNKLKCNSLFQLGMTFTKIALNNSPPR